MGIDIVEELVRAWPRRPYPEQNVYYGGLAEEEIDQIMMLESFQRALGVDRPTRPTFPTEPQQAIEPVKFADGRQVKVGPFLFPENKSGPFDMLITFDGMQQRADLREFGNWAIDQVRRLSAKMPCSTITKDGKVWANVVQDPMRLWCRHMVPTIADWKRDPKGHHYKDLGIPDDSVWNKQLMDGSKPIAKFRHPKFNQDWGVYMTVEKDTYGRGRLRFTFKKQPPGFWGDLWNWIKKLVAKVYEFLKDLFDVFMGAFCSIADSYMADLSKISKQDPQALSTGTISKFEKIGVSSVQLDAVWKGTLTGQGVQALANGVAMKVCPKDEEPFKPTPPEVEGEGISTGVLLIGGAAVTAALLFFL